MVGDQFRLSLLLLGSFRCLLNGRDVSANFRTKKERALLAYLAVESDRHHQREALGELFWPDKPEGYARMNLRQALLGVRKAIQAGQGKQACLVISDEFVRFKCSHYTDIDSKQFDQIYNQTTSHQHQNIENCPTCIELLEDLISLYRGEFLEEFLLFSEQEFREWALYRRENYFRRLLSALQILIKHHQDRGAIKQALEYAYQQANLAQLDERAHRQLMTLLALDGRRSAAMEQYQLCSQILADELDISPDLETTALYEKIKAGLVINQHHPITTPNNTNLPVQFTRFIGREREMAWALAALRNPSQRFITLTGISGVGKTRLAIQTGARLLNDFVDGVWFVPLNAIHDIDLIPKNIAQILKIQIGEVDARRAVLRALRSANLLLIIDNFEHLLEGTSYLIEILRESPKVKILVTSQHRITYQAARDLTLQGLPYPGENDPEWRDYDAVTLFSTRARHTQADFEMEDGDAVPVVQICKTLDGLPLGLELAAAGIRLYSCEQIARAIQRSFSLLQTTMQDIPERHRSIRAAFDQSWAMLTEAEQDACRRLSVFQGEFSLDNAIAATGASIIVISNLVDRCLIQKNASGRYQIQPILRQYAAQKLQEIYDYNDSELIFTERDLDSITRDTTTHLPNKVLFRDLFQQSLAMAHRHQKILALLLIEICEKSGGQKETSSEAFKPILRQTADIITESVRESDVVAHLLPGKFAIILDGIVKYQDGALVARKIQANFNRAQLVGPNEIPLGLRIGISVYPQDSSDIVELLQYANKALTETLSTEERIRFYSYEESLVAAEEV